ncbi:MAG: hypothetical protein PHH93_08930, partial [Prolixibacteraceae bacterium]|nr:hypothetical protein [Prolixibacteraceae bacterium]
MIARQLFDDLMTKAGLFTGQNMKKAASDVIYDEIKANYTNGDFKEAISDIMELEQFRFNGPSIVKRLNYHRSVRCEKEAEQ